MKYILDVLYMIIKTFLYILPTGIKLHTINILNMFNVTIVRGLGYL